MNIIKGASVHTCEHILYLQTCHRVIAALCVWAVDMSVSTVSTQPSIYSIYTCTVHTLGGLTAAVDTPQLASDADAQMSSLFMGEEDLVDFVFFIALEIFE